MRNIQDKSTNEVIHCETKEEWDMISKLLGCVWGDDEYWEDYKADSCIRNRENYADAFYYIRQNYAIIPAKEFLNYSSEPLTFN